MSQAWARANRILTVVGGSHAYGTATPTSDRDVRGVALPPPAWLLGFSPQETRWTVESRTPRDDVVIHALPKFCRLALNANPTILDVLFCHDDDVLTATTWGLELRHMREAFLSKRAYQSFSGYAAGQLQRMRSHNTDHGARQGAIAQYGYDVKNAMHLIRLLLVARYLLTAGLVYVRLPDADVTLLRKIRAGHFTAAEIQARAADLDRQCVSLRDGAPLPEEPDRARVEAWLIQTQTAWCQEGVVI